MEVYPMFVLMTAIYSVGQTLKPRASEEGRSPFVPIWNAPTEFCMKKFRVSIDVSMFETVGSTSPTAKGQNITIFYTDRLGYYPYIDLKTGVSYNGGIPQMINIDQHIKKAKLDILNYITSGTQTGLAVIDWEDWRPTWIRNWASKEIYKKQSIDLIQQKDLTLTRQRAESMARAEFESSAKRLMITTLRLAKHLRPNYLWGFYLFPNCHNYDYKQNPNNYTGSCPDIEMSRNDRLKWMWKESTALFPNMYLETALRSSQLAALYTRNRILEAKRLSDMSKTKLSLPIYVYIRPVFTDSPEQFISQMDLVHTIGESAALGAAGFVMWGSMNLTQSLNACMTLNTFIINTLNPYILNVSLSAKLCSVVLCQSKGACIRKAWNSSTYLHLNQTNISLQRYQGTYKVSGSPSREDIRYLFAHFKCHCYAEHKCQGIMEFQQTGPLQVCTAQNICMSVKQGSFSGLQKPDMVL